LFYNFSPAKIFLGDTGSLLVGLIISFLAVQLAKNPINLELNGNKINVGVFIFSCIFVPVFDTIRVFFIRIIRGKSPFHPDLNHMHHLLLNIGFKHAQVTCILGLFALAMIFVSYFFQSYGITVVASLLLTIALIFSFILTNKKMLLFIDKVKSK
jgi:UDP-N-acetylmuramyl pentapeptide phosphotransferase/UDP-N-acetylglucosamine-1-phosphate transferase